MARSLMIRETSNGASSSAGAKKDKIVVLGTGYVGFPLAVLLARSGFKVVGVDIRKEVVRAINEGNLPIREREIEAIFKEPSVRRNLIASETVTPGDVYVISVPTPLEKRRKIADLGSVIAATESILPHLRKGNMVILESTVPPLTCREVLTPLIERAGDLKANEDIGLVHCPERILPGNIFEEIVKNDRVIGSISVPARERAAAIYQSFVKGRIFLTDDVTAELVKIMENTFRDVNIALANEFAMVAETLGVDIEDAIEIANAHPRVEILRPGIGVGGHCIPIDPWFLTEVDPAHTNLITVARRINDSIPGRVSAKLRLTVADVPEPKIVLIGMSYKPDTEDLRESPAVEVAEMLREDGYDVRQYDPLIQGKGYDTLVEAARGADLLAILVPHSRVIEEYHSSELQVKAVMRTPRVLTF
jgi:UDP-N-acetyl-D-mannosaminuronic acid dehydrogenase